MRRFRCIVFNAFRKYIADESERSLQKHEVNNEPPGQPPDQLPAVSPLYLRIRVRCVITEMEPDRDGLPAAALTCSWPSVPPNASVARRRYACAPRDSTRESCAPWQRTSWFCAQLRSRN